MAVSIQYTDFIHPVIVELHPRRKSEDTVDAATCDLCGEEITDVIIAIFTSPGMEEVSHVSHILDAQADIAYVTKI